MLFRNIIHHFFPHPQKYSFWLFTTSKYLFSLSKKWPLHVRYLLTSNKLSIQILKVSLILKLIIQITLALLYRIFHNLKVSTHLILQLILVANQQTGNYLLINKQKYCIKYCTIPSKFQKLTSEINFCVSAHWVKCTCKELSGFLSCYKTFLGVLKGVTDNINFRQQYDFLLNDFIM